MYLYDEEVFEELRYMYDLPNKDIIKENRYISDIISIDEIINYVYNSVSKLFRGKFYIGEKGLKEYMQFYLLTYLHMKIYDNENGAVSLEKYYNQYFSEDSEENKIYKEDKEKRISLNINTKRTLERRWKEFNKDNIIYNNQHDFGANDINNRKGHEISKEQINEMEFLLKNYDNSAIKKIRNNKFCKLTFKELTEYNMLAKEEIESSEDLYKNIRYYKFERRTHYELFKKIINLMNKNNYSIDDNEDIVTKYIISLMRVQDIKNVYKYAELFFKLSPDEYPVYFKELEHLSKIVYNLLIGYSVYILESYNLEEQIKCNKLSEGKLLKIYNLEDYYINFDMTDINTKIGDKLIKISKSVVVQN